MGILGRIVAPVRQARSAVGGVVGLVVEGVSGRLSRLSGAATGNGRPALPSPAELRVGELATGAPDSVAEVVGRLAAIYDVARGSPRGETDGIACFTHLYRTITANVLLWLEEGRFQNSEFLAMLDLEFAGRYFQALRCYAFDRPSTPMCWRVLFDNRSRDRISRLHFAAAGVNAHINFDLALALISTCERLGVELGGPGQRDDYLSVNQIFAANTLDLRDSFETTEDSALTDAVEKFFDDFCIIFTRQVAWDDAVRLWPHRRDAVRTAAQTRLLDDRASVLGRAMLVNPFLR
jgi:hypothetical protein